jgi:serine/threonine-protein kinase
MMLDWLVGSTDEQRCEASVVHPRAEVSAIDAAPSFGDVIADRYLVESKIGYGGAGVVYRGRDLQSDASLALKILWRADGESDKTLRPEAATHMCLTHPHIVRVHSYLTFPRYDVLVMSLETAGDLQRIRRGRPDGVLSEEEAVGYCMDLLDALAYAHGRGILHNDIKPQNMLLGEDGGVKLCDFGASVRAGRDVGGMSLPGTYAYTSPERLRLRAPDPRSDIYSVGATLYTLLHGEPPFGSMPETAVYGHLDKVVPVSERIPAPLHEVIVRAMAKAPHERYPSALAMRQGLEALGYAPRARAEVVKPIYSAGSDGVYTLDVRPSQRAAARSQRQVAASRRQSRDGRSLGRRQREPLRAGSPRQNRPVTASSDVARARRAVLSMVRPVGSPNVANEGVPVPVQGMATRSQPLVGHSDSFQMAMFGVLDDDVSASVVSGGSRARLVSDAGLDDLHRSDPELTAPSTRATMKAHMGGAWSKPMVDVDAVVRLDVARPDLNRPGTPLRLASPPVVVRALVEEQGDELTEPLLRVV